MSSELNLPTDEELIAKYYACDPNAFKTLWMGQAKPLRIGYRSRLVKYLARQFPNIKEHDRENIVDEIGLKVVQSKYTGSYKTDRPFRTWVFSLAHHQACDFLKKRDNGMLTGQESEDGTPLNTIDLRVPARDGFEDSTVDRAYEAIDQLPARERDVLLLRLNGLTNQDVAAVLGIAQSGASKLLGHAMILMGNAMNDYTPDEGEELDPTKGRFFQRLQERHERELTVAFERMKRHKLLLDDQGRIVGFTEAAQRSDFEYIVDHLRGVLPVYLLRQGIDTSHANGFYAKVVSRLGEEQDSQPNPSKRFRETLAGYLADYCTEAKITSFPAEDESEFLHRLLQKEDDAADWVRQMKEWLQHGTIRKVDDLVNPLQWPQSLNKQRFFTDRMRQLHGALSAVLKTESDLLDGQT